MEHLLILLLALVLFLEYGDKLREQLVIAIKSNPLGVIKYISSAGIVTLAFTNLPFHFLNIYMRENGFFAYEVFDKHQISIQVLSVNYFEMLFMLTIFLFAVFIAWKKKAGKTLIISLSLGSFIVIAGLIGIAVYNHKYYLVLSLFVFCSMLGLYLYFCFFTEFSNKAKFWWMPIGITITVLVLAQTFSEITSSLTETALLYNRVGGMEDVKLFEHIGFSTEKSTVLTGKLLLRTPEFYYLRPTNNQNSVLIIPSDHASISYKHELK